MAKVSITWPPALTPRGGVEAREGGTLEQAIVLSLLPGKSANPFERQEGIGYEGVEYEIAGDVATRLRAHVEERFAVLERQGRARLVAGPTLTEIGEGRVKVAIRWYDLETRVTRESEVTL